jgi:soluble lytic murein transglycosylase
MKRLLIIILILIPLAALGLYFFNQYWIHRYDDLIAGRASIYRLDPDLVWSIIYEETYFRSWKVGNDGEIGLMQVTPTVGREWAAELKNSMPDLERQMEQDPKKILSDPQRNIEIGCWYLEKLYEQYRDLPGVEARMVAGYNAGRSRVEEWSRVADGAQPLSAEQFIARIDIPSTRAYVTNILTRYRKLKEERARQPSSSSTTSGTQTTNAPEAGR